MTAESSEPIARRFATRRARSGCMRSTWSTRPGSAIPAATCRSTDILATLYFGVLRVDPKAPRDPGRDRLILSKGHASGALYATLAEAGFIPVEWLSTYMKPRSMLNGHPNRNYVPGVEANTGPLGHGMPIAVGVAHRGEARSKRTSASSSSPATANCRREAIGRRRWPPATTSSPIWR